MNTLRSTFGFCALAVGFTFVMVSAQELSMVWLFLMIMGLAFGAFCFLVGAPTRVLFASYCAAVSIEITKGLVAEGGVYTPGLYLSLSDLFLGPLLIGLAFGRLIKRQPAHKGGVIFKLAVVWVIYQWFSAVLSPAGLGAYLGALNQTKYFLALYMFSVMLRKTEHWKDLMFGVFIGLGLHLLMSALQVATNGAIQLQGIKASTQQTLSYAGAGLLNLIRPSGMLSHPNALADYLVLLMPGCALLLLLKNGLGRSRVYVAIALLGSTLMLVLTLSRGGWGAFAIGIAVMVLMAYRRQLITFDDVKRMLIVAMLGVILVAVTFPSVILRLTESDNKSTSSRVLLAEQAILIFERNPVLGVGLGGYVRAAHRNIPESFSAMDPYFRDVLLNSLVHNKYLLVAAEMGAVGLALFLSLFGVTFWKLAKARYPGDDVRQAINIGIVAGLAASLVTFLLEHAYMGVAIETVWITLGAAIAITQGQGATELEKQRLESLGRVV